MNEEMFHPEPLNPPTSFFVRSNNKELVQGLEEERREYELIYGPTDPEIPYTTQMSDLDQYELSIIDPLKYFQGVPPFCRKYIRNIALNTARRGELDSLPPRFLQAWVESRGKLGL